MRLREDQVRALLIVARETHDVETYCDEFLTVMGRYVEARIAGRPVTEELRKASEHERFCSNCREEVAVLDQMLQECREELEALVAKLPETK
jgi:hypothetical protein